MVNNLLLNVHSDLKAPIESGNSYLVKGKYNYYHYLCDGVDDRGWGCGYRTLQTVSSWIARLVREQNIKAQVPTLKEIQQILVDIGDKPEQFLNSKEWIGSVEVCYVIDTLYNVPCKILHVDQGNKLESIVPSLIEHFQNVGSPIMMGGDKDCSSKGVMGVYKTNTSSFLLIVDPHFVGKADNSSILQDRGWISWKNINDFVDSSFYNLCLPQIKIK